MTIRKFKVNKFKLIKKQLLKEDACMLEDDCYNIPIEINNIGYMLNVQFVDENRILVWEALEIDQNDESGGNYTVITESKILSALLNILLWQKVKGFNSWE